MAQDLTAAEPADGIKLGPGSGTPVTLYLELGPHDPEHIARALEHTLKVVAKDRLMNDDADAIGRLEDAYGRFYGRDPGFDGEGKKPVPAYERRMRARLGDPEGVRCPDCGADMVPGKDAWFTCPTPEGCHVLRARRTYRGYGMGFGLQVERESRQG